MKRSGLGDIWPLSPMQHGMLFHVLYDRGATDVYRGQVVFNLEGPLDRAALRSAGEALLRRHPSLRAGFRALKSGDPVQVIPRDLELPWSELDLRTAAEQDERFAELLQEEWARPFDIEKPPLLRLTVVRLGDERYRAVLTIHHILCDGWSTSILSNELLELYRRGGVIPRLPGVARTPAEGSGVVGLEGRAVRRRAHADRVR
jgi:NRPS condensation-like uncharacterized protein